jgi:hypothetical protein
MLVRWRKERLRYAEQALTGHGRLDTGEARIAALARMIG